MRPVARYERQRWGAEEGFPGGGVHAITQGSDGYLWLGTERGLVRFDGTEFRLVTGPDAALLGGRDLFGVVVDAAGSLWLRPDRPALLRYRNSGFENVPFATDLREVAVTAMTVGRGGELIVYAQVSGLLVRRADRFERVALEAVPPSIVLSMAEASDGTLFLGTRDAGLFRTRGRRVEPLVAGLPDRKVNCLVAVSDRELWVGTDHGVVRWNGSALTTDKVPPALRGVQALALLRDRDANVWVGTGTGLLRASAEGKAEFLGSPPGSPRAVTALFEDREGDVWLGGGAGIERLHDRPFTTWSRAQGLPSDGGGAIHVDRADRVWFAPPEGGLYRLKGARVEPIAAAGLAADRVYSIAQAPDGVWVGRQRGGLTRLRDDGAALRSHSYDETDGLAQASVYAVHQGRDGSVWAGTLNGGLSRLRDGRIDTFTTANGLPSNSVSALVDTRDGTLWAGTPAGLASWSGGAWTTRRVADGLPSDNVTALLEDAQGVLWIGTSEGLAFLRSGRIESSSKAPAPLHEAVVGLAESEGGWLWLATTRRVMSVRREPLLHGTLGDADVVTYGREDGLLGLEGVRRHRSVVTDLRGRIWFSTNRGLSVVHPRRATAVRAPPLVHVRSLFSDERPIDLGASVRVPPSPQRVRFAYTGVSLQAPERVRFRHRLDGFDARWSEPVSTQEAVYANLSPGAYQFRVEASGADGLWNGPEATVAFTIAPAVWQTTAFRLTAVLAVALCGWLLYVWRLGQATRRLNAAFEARLAERTRIARELHDTLLQGFVSASMQLHVAIEQVPEALPARSLIVRVQRLMGQVIEEGRNTVRELRSVECDTGDLAQDLSRVGEDMPGVAAAEVRVIVEGSPRALHPSVRDELYRIGREALVNAFLHAQAKRIEVELEYAPRAVRLLVRDDGVGVDPGVLRDGRDGHYGLSGMGERAERIGGRLRLWSAPGAGTEVEVVVRSAVAFAGLSGPRRWGWLKAVK
jgi:signal transduction histidine kinase/ligand-binding sensor domain-containing protein